MSLYFMTFGLQPLGVVAFGAIAEPLGLRASMVDPWRYRFALYRCHRRVVTPDPKPAVG